MRGLESVTMRQSGAGLKVLSIEDNVDSTSSLIEALRDVGVSVTEVATIPNATQVVRGTLFDFIIVDARVPDVNRFDVRGGIDFVKQLKEGDFGAANIDTRFIVLTSFVHEIDSRELIGMSGFASVLSKTSMTAMDLGELLGLELDPAGSDTQDQYIMEDLLVVEAPPRADHKIFVLVPAWSEGEGIFVNESDLPEDVFIEYQMSDRPFFMWARVNVAAKSAAEVGPRSYRLHIADAVDYHAFELDSDTTSHLGGE